MGAARAAFFVAALGCSLPLAARAQYTLAINSFGPADADVFVARGDGSDARPFLASPAADYNASISADGQWVLFTSDRAGNADIYRARIDGTALERLVDDPAFDDQAALSPDGRSLAFVSSRSGNADVWVLELATRRAYNVTSAPSGEFRPAWSPDGLRLAFSSDRNPPRTSCLGQSPVGPGPFVTPQYTAVFTSDVDGSNLAQISAEDEVAGRPSWSRDGSSVVFHAADSGQVCSGGLMFANGTSQIVSVNLASGERTALTSGDGVKLTPYPAGGATAYVTATSVELIGRNASTAGAFGWPAWSGDGQTMVFHRDVGNRAAALPRPSRDPKFALVAVPGHAAYSPGGDRIAFSNTDFSAGAPTTGSLVVADADGSNRQTLFSAPPMSNLTAPVWSPRGDAIVFGVGAYLRRAGQGPAELMSVAPDGTALTVLSDGIGNDGMASWSPDGRSLVFRVADGAARGIKILDLGTGERRSLATGSDRDTFPSWSPRGDWITFTSQRDGDYEIYRIRPDGTGLTRLTRLAGHDAHASISPDGEWIAFATSRGGFKDEAIGLVIGARPPPFQAYGEIAVMRIDGTELTELTDNSIEEGVPVWRPSRPGPP
jgi:Tol biopolymer transport system component